jgi:hypothetical protein
MFASIANRMLSVLIGYSTIYCQIKTPKTIKNE